MSHIEVAVKTDVTSPVFATSTNYARISIYGHQCRTSYELPPGEPQDTLTRRVDPVGLAQEMIFCFQLPFGVATPRHLYGLPCKKYLQEDTI